MKLFRESDLFDTSEASFSQRLAIYSLESWKSNLALWILLTLFLVPLAFVSELQLFKILSAAGVIHVILGFQSKALISFFSHQRILEDK